MYVNILLNIGTAGRVHQMTPARCSSSMNNGWEVYRQLTFATCSQERCQPRRTNHLQDGRSAKVWGGVGLGQSKLRSCSGILFFVIRVGACMSATASAISVLLTRVLCSAHCPEGFISDSVQMQVLTDVERTCDPEERNCKVRCHMVSTDVLCSVNAHSWHHLPMVLISCDPIGCSPHFVLQPFQRVGP